MKKGKSRLMNLFYYLSFQFLLLLKISKGWRHNEGLKNKGIQTLLMFIIDLIFSV